PGVFVHGAADLDRDGLDELVASDNQSFVALRADGTRLPITWPAHINFGQPVIADIDHDSFPEILTVTDDNFELKLEAFRHDGSVLKQWPLFGISGRVAVAGIPAVGDFDHDGRTDLAVHS